jgi:ribonucleoside-diphosphate reductase alpha chain
MMSKNHVNFPKFKNVTLNNKNKSSTSMGNRTSNNQNDSFIENLDKYSDLVSYFRWNPDLWYDFITPEMGGIRLGIDQRIFMRSMARFISLYGVFPRGYGKTLKEVMVLYHTAIFYPDIELSMTAQTRENASKLVEEKHRELLRFYPLLKDEIVKEMFTKDMVDVRFTSGGIINILANHQSTKGARRKRLMVEESNLLNDELFQDVLEPVVNIPRRTIGRLATVNPEELNGQICFLTTSGFRGSSEFVRNIKMVDEMADLKGKIVLGSSWQLACYMGRGETKSQILAKKDSLSPIFFAQNYCSQWVGNTDNQLVDINRLMSVRVLRNAELKGDGISEYFMGVDVARSADKSNNQTSVAIAKIKRHKNGRIKNIDLVNLVNISNTLNFNAQAVEVKKLQKLYNVKVLTIDTNGLGAGLLDKLLEENTDPVTGDILPCFDTINTEQEPEYDNAERVVFDLKPQSANSDIIISFIDSIEGGKLRLLEKKSHSDFDMTDNNLTLTKLPYINTDFLIEEIANLKMKQLSSGKYSVESVVKRLNKDRYSALAYVVWYISKFEDVIQNNNDDSTIFDYLIL